MEWYDWYAYSAFALYFAPVFFPKGSTTAQLLNTAAIFAGGFLMRPLGAWLLGAYADRHATAGGRPCWGGVSNWTKNYGKEGVVKQIG
ncbi:hypothetical protein [Hymenobacter montanus]|uniref:hypothetical protein n=1 Tax=Hymenobacter montanus TaxID=2771359 RepID=UPI00293BA4B2|nr:hypothetical protein [Hymenobacter montanus]